MRALQLFIALIFSYGIVNAQVTDELICAEKAHFHRKAFIEKRANNDAYHGYNIGYHRCFWKLNPYEGSDISGSVLFQFRVDNTVDSLAFDLIQQLQVDSVSVNGKLAKTERRSNQVFVFNDQKWKAGSLDSFTVYYHGNPAGIPGGWGAYTYDNHATGPIIHTLSQPYGAPFWWPCKQSLTDKIDSIDIYVETHKDFKVGSNGIFLSDVSTSDELHKIHWSHRYPVVTYLVAIAVTNYVEFTDYAHFDGRSDSLPVLNYVFPQFEASSRSEVKDILPMLRLMDSLFIPYPFEKEKYGHAQFTWGGGMEHQTMSFMVNFSFDLMAHEVAHQWFGDMVTCGSWNDLWLNEGYATYLTAVCHEYLRGKEDFKFQMRAMRNNITAKDDGSVKPSDTSQVNVLFNGRLTYRKGAWLLHMLRNEMGDSLFFEGCRTFLTGGNRAYAFSTTNEYREVMESVSGRDLHWFFKQWYEGQGHPELKINWEQQGREVKIKIDQTPSHPSVPMWKIQVPIEFSNVNGESELCILQPKELSFDTVITLGFAADTAVFDPNITVLAKASLGGLNLNKIQKEEVVVAPNPSATEWNIYARNQILQKVEVYNDIGQLVYSKSLDSAFNTKIPLLGLSSGTYITRIYTDNIVYSRKCIKEED
ncbi:MAG: M1 family aminopeptidase [Bacteroidota bacterium]|nr:M1 family aminopeptidase [Bacteroidota bacterium]